MNLFLLLTAMLSALAGVGRPMTERLSAAVEASRPVAVAQAVAPIMMPRTAERPNGYVAPPPLRIDLRMALDVVVSVAPERRRE